MSVERFALGIDQLHPPTVRIAQIDVSSPRFLDQLGRSAEGDICVFKGLVRGVNAVHAEGNMVDADHLLAGRLMDLEDRLVLARRP